MEMAADWGWDWELEWLWGHADPSFTLFQLPRVSKMNKKLFLLLNL